MEPITVRLFGTLEISRGNVLLPAFATRKAERLVAFLALDRKRLISREVLCGHFWGDQAESDARRALRTELWRIRAVLEPTEQERGAFLRAEGHVVGLVDTDNVWVDTAEFEAGVRVHAPNGDAALRPGEAVRLESAAALYRGDFLEGHYDDWSLGQRERLRMMHLTALERLVAHYQATGQWQDAINRGRQLLREDPFREHIHRVVMASCVSMGDRASALRQYQLCVRSLREELDIEPMDETRRLYEAIRSGGVPRLLEPSHHACRPEPDGMERAGRAVAEVDRVLSDLYALAERLERTRASFLASGEDR